MDNVLIEKLTIISSDKKFSSQYTFTNNVNFILSDKNSSGKTTVLKLIYKLLGCNVKISKEIDCCFIKLDLCIGKNNFSIYKLKDIYFIEKNNILSNELLRDDFIEEITSILNYNIFLVSRDEILRRARPAHFFSISYISQNKTWAKILDNDFENLQEFSNYRKDLLNQFCRIDEEILENKIEISKIKYKIKMNNVVLGKLEYYKEDNDFNDIEEKISDNETNLIDLKDKILFLIKEKVSLKREIDFFKIISKNLEQDYNYALELGVRITCPVCNTIHSNDALSQADLFFRKDKINEKIKLKEKDLSYIKKELSQAKSKLAILEMRDNDFIDNNLMKSLELSGVKLINNRIKKENYAANEKIDILKKENNSIKKQPQNKNKTKIVNDNFIKNFQTYYSKLKLKFKNVTLIKKVIEYNKIIDGIDGGSADRNRGVLAYYLALYETIIQSGYSVIPPLVIDTPNQNEQDDDNYHAIIDTILSEENKQIIVCSIKNRILESSLNTVNKIYVNRLLENHSCNPVHLKEFDKVLISDS